MNQTDDQPIRAGDRVRLYKRGKKGIWTAEFWNDGGHQRRSLKTRNARIAKDRAHALDRDLALGQFSAREPKRVYISLFEAIDGYVGFVRGEGGARKTVVKYEGVLKRKFQPFAVAEGVVKVHDVTLPLIDRYRAQEGLRLSKKSMHNEGVMLKTFLGWCTDRNYIRENPLASQKFRRPKLNPVGGPTLEQINQILAAASAIRLAPLAVLAFTGARAGEVQHLRPEDVDLQNNWIHIVSREGAKTKTGESRKVPIHPRLGQILATVPKGKRQWYFTALPSRKYRQGGHHLNMKHVCEDIKKILAKLGIPIGKKNRGFTLHSLRSSFKTICIHASIPREVVDEWQGHAGRRPTASDAYYRLRDEDSQAFMLHKAPFGAANSPGSGDNQGGV